MPDGLQSVLVYLRAHRGALIAGGAIFALLLTAVLTLVIALKRARRLRVPRAAEAKAIKDAKPPVADTNPPPHKSVTKTKLAIGDAASPWTQGVYERHSPENKIDLLLPPFAFDENGGIHRVQTASATHGVDVESVVRLCDTAAGLAVNGVYATLLLWHLGDSRYSAMAFKVASHAHIAPEQKELIQFLFQDVLGAPRKPSSATKLLRFRKPAFRAAVTLYTSAKISPDEWVNLKTLLPAEFLRFYQLELAQKLPPKMIYRQAAESPVYTEGLFRKNLDALRRYMSLSRWMRVKNSGNAARLAAWVQNQPIETEDDALFQIANPDVHERQDIEPEKLEKITRLLDGPHVHAWLFDDAQKPKLIRRLHYFKYFCLLERSNEAVRCFALLGVFRRDRATRLYYARALFAVGMHHDAWSEISALMTEYPKDAAILNEAAIYAHRLGRFEESGEIFAMARALYPDDATLAYNEAVFTEKYSQVRIEEKWSAVQKLAQPPVVG